MGRVRTLSIALQAWTGWCWVAYQSCVGIFPLPGVRVANTADIYIEDSNHVQGFVLILDAYFQVQTNKYPAYY